MTLPSSTLLEVGGLPLEELADIARREGQNTRAIYRVHRWFARRLSSQFRAILTALTLESDEAERFWEQYYGEVRLDGLIALDPFVGGGTALSEARRCGARVIGFDIDPVAASIARFGLSIGRYQEGLEQAFKRVETIREQVSPYHVATADGQEVTVVHHFWVEVLRCPTCESTTALHPHYQLAYDRRRKLQWVFCRSCAAVHEFPISRKRFQCFCGVTTQIHRGPYSRGMVSCPACRSRTTVIAARDAGSPPQWRLFAQEYMEGEDRRSRRLFRAVTEADHQLFRQAAQRLRDLEAEEVLAPGRPIPTEHRWDRRPLIHNIGTYRQLFNDRQLLHLTILGRAIRETRDEPAQRVLATAFTEHLTTSCMYTGYAFGYRRTSPLFSIHGYRHIVRPVELNPWLTGIGRGTYPNALRKIGQAIRYAENPKELCPGEGIRSVSQAYSNSGQVHSDVSSVLRGVASAAIRADDARQLRRLPANSIDLVITDPPYFDNLSYSELSDFYLAWQQMIRVAEAPYTDPTSSAPIEANLAATSRSPAAIKKYERLLTTIFSQCHRVLRPGGLCVFTFHHESKHAWLALTRAIIWSGFRCTAVVPMRGEGEGGLHSKNGTIKWDAVLVCRSRNRPLSENLSIWVPKQYVKESILKVNRTAEKLKDCDFREPDQQNFLRALIAKGGEFGCPPDDSFELPYAMNEEILRDGETS